MKLVILGAVIGATLLGALPASAQIVVRDRDRDAVVVRHVDRDHDRNNWRRHHADCRAVKVRTHLPNGNVIIKTQRSCD